MRRGQRSFRPDNKEDRNTCQYLHGPSHPSDSDDLKTSRLGGLDCINFAILIVQEKIRIRKCDYLYVRNAVLARYLLSSCVRLSVCQKSEFYRYG